ncbi:hypothetical protein CYMTET_17452 [Cymbomonas tetramitiformis]|uniref:Uncharacterized protein n=1 Tax=Cymbomonas tetramitiformis TaxID=36881 RepID=A0AAE0GAD8_9CHLO|nr:hypothetical protein CYMTET_17452 [Cymbomonas tetramitiformis]
MESGHLMARAIMGTLDTSSGLLIFSCYLTQLNQAISIAIPRVAPKGRDATRQWGLMQCKLRDLSMSNLVLGLWIQFIKQAIPTHMSKSLPACPAATASLKEILNAWGTLGEVPSLLHSTIYATLVRRAIYSLATTLTPHEDMPSDPGELITRPGSLDFISGWVLRKIQGSRQVKIDTKRVVLVQSFVGPWLPNMTNFIFESPELKGHSLVGATPAFVQYMELVEKECQRVMTSVSLFHMGRGAYLKWRSDLQQSKLLWTHWQTICSEAGLWDADIRLVQGLVIDRYLHMRQGEELARRKLHAQGTAARPSDAQVTTANVSSTAIAPPLQTPAQAEASQPTVQGAKKRKRMNGQDVAFLIKKFQETPDPSDAQPVLYLGSSQGKSSGVRRTLQARPWAPGARELARAWRPGLAASSSASP